MNVPRIGVPPAASRDEIIQIIYGLSHGLPPHFSFLLALRANDIVAAHSVSYSVTLFIAP